MIQLMKSMIPQLSTIHLAFLVLFCYPVFATFVKVEPPKIKINVLEMESPSSNMDDAMKALYQAVPSDYLYVIDMIKQHLVTFAESHSTNLESLWVSRTSCNAIAVSKEKGGTVINAKGRTAIKSALSSVKLKSHLKFARNCDQVSLFHFLQRIVPNYLTSLPRKSELKEMIKNIEPLAMGDDSTYISRSFFSQNELVLLFGSYKMECRHKSTVTGKANGPFINLSLEDFLDRLGKMKSFEEDKDGLNTPSNFALFESSKDKDGRIKRIYNDNYVLPGKENDKAAIKSGLWVHNMLATLSSLGVILSQDETKLYGMSDFDDSQADFTSLRYDLNDNQLFSYVGQNFPYDILDKRFEVMAKYSGAGQLVADNYGVSLERSGQVGFLNNRGKYLLFHLGYSTMKQKYYLMATMSTPEQEAILGKYPKMVTRNEQLDEMYFNGPNSWKHRPFSTAEMKVLNRKPNIFRHAERFIGAYSIGKFSAFSLELKPEVEEEPPVVKNKCINEKPVFPKRNDFETEMRKASKLNEVESSISELEKTLHQEIDELKALLAESAKAKANPPANPANNLTPLFPPSEEEEPIDDKLYLPDLPNLQFDDAIDYSNRSYEDFPEFSEDQEALEQLRIVKEKIEKLKEQREQLEASQNERPKGGESISTRIFWVILVILLALVFIIAFLISRWRKRRIRRAAEQAKQRRRRNRKIRKDRQRAEKKKSRRQDEDDGYSSEEYNEDLNFSDNSSVAAHWQSLGERTQKPEHIPMQTLKSANYHTENEKKV